MNLFNKDLKEEFLAQYSENTKINNRRILSKAYPTEVKLNKDLYDFNHIELDALFREYGAKTKQSIISIVSIISQYIEFCRDEKHLIKTGINYASYFKSKDLDNYVNRVAIENKYITEQQLIYLVDRFIENSQDGVIFELLFRGIKGKGNAELLNLKVTDVNEVKNQLIVTDEDGAQRIVDVPMRTIRVIKDAIKETLYYKNNGMDLTDLDTLAFKVVETEYVLRPAVSGEYEQGKLNRQNINNRIKKIRKYFGNDYLTPTTIWVSGMIHKAKQIVAEKGELTNDDIKQINKHFGYSIDYWYTTKRRILPYIKK